MGMNCCSVAKRLKIRKFLGENENAIRIQLIAAMIAFVLLRIAAKLHAVTLPALRYPQAGKGGQAARSTRLLPDGL